MEGSAAPCGCNECMYCICDCFTTPDVLSSILTQIHSWCNYKILAYLKYWIQTQNSNTMDFKRTRMCICYSSQKLFVSRNSQTLFGSSTVVSITLIKISINYMFHLFFWTFICYLQFKSVIAEKNWTGCWEVKLHFPRATVKTLATAIYQMPLLPNPLYTRVVDNRETIPNSQPIATPITFLKTTVY